jgi:hypothetical protein
MSNRLDTFPGSELIKQYRNTFGSNEGKVVLAHMLYELGLFEEVSLSPEDMALKNYASRILRICGGGDVKVDTIKNFISQLNLQKLKNVSQNEGGF